MMGIELGRLLKCGDLKAMGGGGILPYLGRLPLKKGPMAYRGTLPGQEGEAEHLAPAALPAHEPLTQEARAHIFYGNLDKRSESKGWHFEPSADPKKGTYVIEKSRSAPDKHGVYEANVMIEGVKKKALSSFFPKDWSQEQVEEAILEAYKDRRPLADGPAHAFEGTCSKGFGIRMDLDGSERILTAYPIMERPKR